MEEFGTETGRAPYTVRTWIKAGLITARARCGHRTEGPVADSSSRTDQAHRIRPWRGRITSTAVRGRIQMPATK